MSTDTLLRAAAAMRERAEAATPGTWMPDPDEEAMVLRPDAPNGWDGYGVAVTLSNEADQYVNTDHIASWHPAVALAVADWLEVVAGYGEPQPGHGTRNWDAALVAARAYLGEEA